MVSNWLLLKVDLLYLQQTLPLAVEGAVKKKKTIYPFIYILFS